MQYPWRYTDSQYICAGTNIVYYVMCNRKGSVIVDFSLWVDASIEDKDLLREILVKEKDFKIHGFVVDPKSIRVSGKFNFPFVCYIHYNIIISKYHSI